MNSNSKKKFFLPAATGDKERDEIWKSIKDFTKEATGWESSNRKIFSICFVHDGNEYLAEVGKKNRANNELVCAILDAGQVYFVCTPSRGVIRGGPILVGKHDTKNVIDFEE